MGKAISVISVLQRNVEVISAVRFACRFMLCVLQGRTGELDLQLKHGKEGPEEVQYKKGTAWLW